MRNFREPTCKNLLKKPLVLGVPMGGLIALMGTAVVMQFFLESWKWANLMILGVLIVGYGSLRVIQKFSRPGWEEKILFFLETISPFMKKRAHKGSFTYEEAGIKLLPLDTVCEPDALIEKEKIREQLNTLKAKESICLSITKSNLGTKISRIKITAVSKASVSKHAFVYSLVKLPPYTDPMWFSCLLGKFDGEFECRIRIDGLDRASVKGCVERARRLNHTGTSLVSNIDEDVAFREGSNVLEGLSIGEETLVRLSLCVTTKEAIDLDSDFFLKEKSTCAKALAVESTMGLKARNFRGLTVRSVTAADFIPSFLDPDESDTGVALLRTTRGNPLYFNALDPRLEAYHWLVVGASGSGKSFFTGLILKRMLENGENVSVLFLDHGRSFEGLVKTHGGSFIDPTTRGELESDLNLVLDSLNEPGQVAGIELSELDITEKKLSLRQTLKRVSEFLKVRGTNHVLYVVVDECWQFLKDESQLVQQMFREFRKLGGACVAITQSFSDFVKSESGEAIVQNAPIRILLRQGEDLESYKGALGLNEVELRRLRFLTQKKGEYSECIIKTPFLSRLGRLYPSKTENSYLTSSNIEGARGFFQGDKSLLETGLSGGRSK